MANLVKRIQNAYLFPNGNLAVFDINGEQISELQGQYSIETHKRIVLEALDNCNFEGFNALPAGFTKEVKDYVGYFRDKNISWEEIHSL